MCVQVLYISCSGVEESGGVHYLNPMGSVFHETNLSVSLSIAFVW